MVLDIRFLHDCLLIENEILVIGDMHIGYEEHVIQKGIFPRVQFKEIIRKLDEIFKLLDDEKIRLKKIVLLGDLKHEFGGISNTEWSDALKLIDYLENKLSRKNRKGGLILIKGNHDNIIGPIARKRDFELKEYYKIKKKGKSICFLHGHKFNKKCLDGSDILIMGHLHPAITLSDKYKKEKYKCFLVGKWKRKKAYVLPSFSGINFGYDVSLLRSEDEKDGFLIVDDKSLRKFEVIIYNSKERKEYNFGKLSKLIKK